MDWVRLHVAVNEAPAAGIAIGTALLVVWAIAGGRNLQKAAFRLFVLAAILAVIAFLSGGPAQTALEHAPGMSKELVDEHWYAARLALFGSTVLGVIGMFAIRSVRRDRALSRTFMLTCFLVCALAVAANAWSVYSGIHLQGAVLREQYLPEYRPEVD